MARVPSPSLTPRWLLHSSFNLMMIRDSDTQAWTRILRPRNRNVTVKNASSFWNVKNASSFWIERTGPPRWRPGPCLLQVAAGRWSESDSKSDSKLPAGGRCTALGVRDSDTQAWTQILRNPEHPDLTPSEPPVRTVSLQNIEKSDIVCDIAYDIIL